MTAQRLRELIAWLKSLLPKARPAPPAQKPKQKQTKPRPLDKREPGPPPVPLTRKFGIDLAWGTISMADLKKAHVSFVVRYLSHDPSKNLHDDYADELAAAGIDTIVVWETTAERAKAGRVAGRADAVEARKQALACGMPKGRPIYFAVDFDATGGDVEAYFWGVVAVLGVTGTGVYGGYRPVGYLLNHNIVKYGWQTYAWSEGRWVAQAQLFQYSNGHKIGGVEVDFDHSAAVADFGGWRA